MDLDPSDPKTWLTGTVGMLLATLAWIWARVTGQQDRHELRLMEIEKTMATKGDIAYLADQVRDNGLRSEDRHNQLLTRLTQD